MKRTTLCLLFISALAPLIAFSAAKPQPPFKINSVSARASQEVWAPGTDAYQLGVFETLSDEGTIFIEMKLSLAVDWGDSRRFVLDRAGVILKSSTGAAYSCIRSKHDNSFSSSEPVEVDLVFAVREGESNLTLQVGDQSTEFLVPQLEPFRHPVEGVTAKIIHAGLVPALSSPYSVYIKKGQKPTIPAKLHAAAGGQILQVTFHWDRLPDASHEFNWVDSTIGLVTDSGTYIRAIAVKDDKGYADGTNYTIEREEWANAWPAPEDYTYYFSVPQSLKSFKLTLYGYPVASGQLH